MGRVYHIARPSFSLTAGNDVMTIIPHATRPFRLLDIYLGGLGTTSAANEISIARISAAGTTGGGALTPRPSDSSSVAFGGTVNTTWSAQPTLSSSVKNFSINANGGQMRYSFINEGAPIDVDAATDGLSIRCVSGSSTITCSVTVEEF